VEHSSDVVILVDSVGTLLFVSESSHRVLGYPANERLGTNAFELVHPDDRPELERRFTELVSTAGGTMTAELRALHKDGSWRYVEGIASNRLDDPALRAVVVSYRDVGERKQGEEELKRALSLLSATLESTADGILVTDDKGRVASYNGKYARMWRVPDEVLESREADRLHQFLEEQLEDPVAQREKLLQLARRPDAESFDMLRFRDGRLFERYSQPQRIGDRVVGRVFSFRDITDRMRAERVQAAIYRIA